MQVLQFQIGAPEIFSVKMKVNFEPFSSPDFSVNPLRSSFSGSVSTSAFHRTKVRADRSTTDGVTTSQELSEIPNLHTPSRMQNPTLSSFSLRPLGEVVCVGCFIPRGTLLEATYPIKIGTRQLVSFPCEGPDFIMAG